MRRSVKYVFQIDGFIIYTPLVNFKETILIHLLEKYKVLDHNVSQ